MNDPFTLVGQIRMARGVVFRKAPQRPPKTFPELRATSASSQVLVFLRNAGGYHRCCEILAGTGRSHSAVSWALLYLRARGLVERVPDAARNSRYLRYKAK